MSKFLNTKDFFLCTGGIMPAQMQTHQQVVSKKDGETKFLTKIDTHTTSIADFSCKKMMILMAIIAVVICALTIATGGAALIAAAAIGGAVGAAAGALICGCQGAAARMWFDYKENVKLGPLQVPAVTDKAHMKCSIFNEEIRLAPHIKNWWQAALVGISNFAGEMFKCVMVGAAAAGVAVLASEGILAFLGNAVMNWGTSFGLGGLLLRGGMGLNQMVQDEYVNGQGASADSFASGFWSMETGTAHSAYNVATGQGKPEDYAGLLAWGAPIGGKADEAVPHDVDAMGANAWEGKPQSGKTGYLGSPRMSRAEMTAYKNELRQKGIDVVIVKGKGVLPEGKQAAFDFSSGTVYLRKGPTYYETFHEGAHAEQWVQLGKERYMQQTRLQREQYVYDRIMQNKDRFSQRELQDAHRYINKVRNENGLEPLEPLDAMENLPKGDLGESGNSSKGADGDVYEDASTAGRKSNEADGGMDKMDDADADAGTGAGKAKTTPYGGFGGDIILDPAKTTTVIGKFEDPVNGFGTKEILKMPDGSFTRGGQNKGGINILDIPTEEYEGLLRDYGPDAGKEMFWDQYNQPFLENAFKSGDNVRLLSDPTNAANRTGFYARELREIEGYTDASGAHVPGLAEKYGYIYDPKTSSYIKP